MLPDNRSACSESGRHDWAGNWRSFAMLWAIPTGAMLIASFLEPRARAVIWTAMLLWMGGACLANARRCGRTHCRVTGPFFLMMAAAVVAFATGLLGLGRNGWSILGGITAVGVIGLWLGSERLWGRYSG